MPEVLWRPPALRPTLRLVGGRPCLSLPAELALQPSEPARAAAAPRSRCGSACPEPQPSLGLVGKGLWGPGRGGGGAPPAGGSERPPAQRVGRVDGNRTRLSGFPGPRVCVRPPGPRGTLSGRLLMPRSSGPGPAFASASRWAARSGAAAASWSRSHPQPAPPHPSRRAGVRSALVTSFSAGMGRAGRSDRPRVRRIIPI